MIGPLELVLLIIIVAIVVAGTGLHRKLPGLGRSAGEGAKMTTEKARELYDANAPKAKELAERASTKGGEVGSKVGDRIDPKEIGRKAGSAAREARDMRSEFKSFLDPPPKGDKPAATPASTPATPEVASEVEKGAESANPPSEGEGPGPAADAERRAEDESV